MLCKIYPLACDNRTAIGVDRPEVISCTTAFVSFVFLSVVDALFVAVLLVVPVIFPVVVSVVFVVPFAVVLPFVVLLFVPEDSVPFSVNVSDVADGFVMSGRGIPFA